MLEYLALAVLVASQAAFVPLVLSDIFREKGPDGLSLTAFLSMTIGATAGVFGAHSLNLPIIDGLMIGNIVSAVGVWMICTMVVNRMKRIFTMADAVSSFGLKHFDLLDRQARNEFDEADLDYVLKFDRPVGEDMAIVQHIRDHIADVGHIHDLSPAPAVYYLPVHRAIIFRVNRQDLQEHKQRMVTRYGAWAAISL